MRLSKIHLRLSVTIENYLILNHLQLLLEIHFYKKFLPFLPDD